jgi:hypothetical protein
MSEADQIFFIQHAKAIKAFVLSHPGYSLPYVRDDQTGKLRWVNRAERRARNLKLGKA